MKLSNTQELLLRWAYARGTGWFKDIELPSWASPSSSAHRVVEALTRKKLFEEGTRGEASGIRRWRLTPLGKEEARKLSATNKRPEV